jgi:hypothetical protein
MLHRVSFSHSPISPTLYVYGIFTAGQQELAGHDGRKRRLGMALVGPEVDQQ